MAISMISSFFIPPMEMPCEVLSSVVSVIVTISDLQREYDAKDILPVASVASFIRKVMPVGPDTFKFAREMSFRPECMAKTNVWGASSWTVGRSVNEGYMRMSQTLTYFPSATSP